MPKLARAVHANPGIRAAYRRELDAMIKSMHKSVLWWVRAAYRQNEARIVDNATLGEDASPSAWLSRVLRRLQRYWEKEWAEKADAIARRFVNSTQKQTGSSYLQAFKAAGFTVKAQPSRVMNDTVKALVAENVSLIKSIPSAYFDSLTGSVQRSISMGRNVKELEKDIFALRYSSEKRAHMIARDQTNKATEAVKRAENKRLGITEGIWVHVPGRKSARRTHMDMNGKRFRLDEGLYDSNEGRRVLPGECVNCCCTYRPVIPTFGE